MPPPICIEALRLAIAGNEYFRAEPYLTTNLVLWPRPLVVFANEKAYDSLSAQQRDVLHLAARDALDDGLLAQPAGGALEPGTSGTGGAGE